MDGPIQGGASDMPRARDVILQDLARARERISQLERARGDAREELESLRLELEAASVRPYLPSRPLLTGTNKLPRTRTDKVTLFRSLFRGREDIFPTRFVSKRTGKAGYAPACANKFRPGLCALRTGGKCGDCSNQAFIRVEDRMVVDHLQGRHVMGVYPLLEDESCWFLAADFDGNAWKEDVAAFRESCSFARVPVAVERSRSGNGAHAWFFFTAPVPARVAREMGCYLITDAMSRRHELGMSSYDRLFPNQDTMPRGGFGNLIALPLQYEPRKQGNTVFVDEQFEPYPDQWAFLASVRRIEPPAVERIAREAALTGRIVGVRSVDIDDEETVAPWMRTPTSQLPIDRSAGSLPLSVNAVLAQRLFVEKHGLPAPLLNRLQRLAAFQNPEFYKKQKMRLSTATTPRVIACASDLPGHVALPRGCASNAEALLNAHGVKLIVEDHRQKGSPLEIRQRRAHSSAARGRKCTPRE
jgi:hypothetical protein